MFPWYYSTNCTQIWKPKVKGCVDEKGIEARQSYISTFNSQQRLSYSTYSTFKNSWVMYGVLFRRSGPNTNSLLLRLYTKDKSVRFCFKLLFFCVKNNKLYWFLSAQGLKVNSLINDFTKEYSVHVTLSSWLLFVVFFLALFVPWAVEALHNVFKLLLLL